MEELSAMANYIDRFDEHKTRIEGVGDMMDVRLNVVYPATVYNTRQIKLD